MMDIVWLLSVSVMQPSAKLLRDGAQDRPGARLSGGQQGSRRPARLHWVSADVVVVAGCPGATPVGPCRRDM